MVRPSGEVSFSSSERLAGDANSEVCPREHYVGSLSPWGGLGKRSPCNADEKLVRAPRGCFDDNPEKRRGAESRLSARVVMVFVGAFRPFALIAPS